MALPDWYIEHYMNEFIPRPSSCVHNKWAKNRQIKEEMKKRGMTASFDDCKPDGKAGADAADICTITEK